ncbi:HepT-like ribonuclease domain-containing protein [Desulfobotulus pelophilus]
MVVHNYFGVDAEEIWQIIKNNLPELKMELQKIVDSFLK